MLEKKRLEKKTSLSAPKEDKKRRLAHEKDIKSAAK
jgi:hypothetical protein